MKKQAFRWIALVLALVMSLSLAACSSKQDTAANDTTGTPAADTAADTQTPSASGDDTNVVKIGLMLQLSGSSPADSEELLKGCELEVIVTDAVTVCNTCGKEYPTVEHGKNCPFCGSTDTVLLRGNEVEIKEIEVN